MFINLRGTRTGRQKTNERRWEKEKRRQWDQSRDTNRVNRNGREWEWNREDRNWNSEKKGNERMNWQEMTSQIRRLTGLVEELVKGGRML